MYVYETKRNDPTKEGTNDQCGLFVPCTTGATRIIAHINYDICVLKNENEIL